MGLDMFLYRAPRVPGLNLDGYLAAEDAVCHHGPDGLADPALLQAHPGTVAVADPRRTFFSLFEEVAYWRKANAIHRWFVEHVHDGADDGYWYALVPDTACRALLDRVTAVLADFDRAPALLPTEAGFFFGSTDYDEWYASNLVETRNQLTRVLDTTDFERQVLLYHCWW